MNWHPEAEAIAERALTTPHLKEAYNKIERNEPRIFQNMVSFFNGLFGWGLTTGEWRATQGSELVGELWEIITTLP